MNWLNELIHVSTWISYHELHSSINIITSFNPIFLPKPRYFEFRFRDSTPGDSLGWAPEKVTVRWKRRYAAWMHQRTACFHYIPNNFPDFSWGDNWAMKKNPGCLGYTGDYTAQLGIIIVKWMSETFQHF